ncbi:alpha-L-fucosidase [Streptoalloteichus hindustanus]|uniref:alpha-L-fucosidase n=1 Tax=Streptoalloteichus hindustanus TaxID=2017 RepID=A0A1M5NYL3_STRHI|nr:alpha-L-fucosidase [Streptoalloteichus hindustanus]SHG94656.1 alpha-L-fucosidase [Streptoalloteichus hindustanus]
MTHEPEQPVAPAAEAPPARPLPPWFDDAKLGIFIHWTAAAIPAFAPVHLVQGLQDRGPNVPRWQQRQFWRTLPYAETYQNTMAVPGSETSRYHAEHYGDLPYSAFVEQFRDQTLPAWEPESWARLFARAGARYVVLTTKTEDGFLLWPSDHPNPHQEGWQAGRDVVGELADAVRCHGLRFGAYYAEGLDWTFGGLPVTDDESFVRAMPTSDAYHAYTDAHWRELITRYQPSVLWNDYCLLPNLDAEALFRTYYQQVPDGVVNDRFDIPRQHDGQLHADFDTREYSNDTKPAARKWEACRGIGTSFGYNQLETEDSYLSSTQLIHLLIDTVAGGGNLLLNVGPTGSGDIPPEQAQRLVDLGDWLATHGDAIYGTRPWHRAKGITTEGLPVRYTASREVLHALVLGTPRGTTIDLDVRLQPGATVQLGACPHPLPWQSSPHGTRVQLPAPPAPEAALSLHISPREAVTDPVD